MRRYLTFLALVVTLLIGGLTAAQDEAIAREAAIAAARQVLNARPVQWAFERFFETRDSSLGCPSAPKGDLGRAVIPYRFTLTYGTGDYVVWASSDGTVVVLCDEKFATVTGNATPVTPATVETPVVTDGACVLSPIGAFANVREVPTVDGRQVGQIFSGQFFPVIATNSNPSDIWYFTTGGWVSRQAAVVTGNCAALPVDETRTGTGAGLTAPTSNIDLARALQDYACPPDFAGYKPPRIRVGEKTAKIGGGTIPNTLRSQPIANDAIGARLGVIQPNRVLDRVANGPACSGGIVWWYVEIDGNIGWTAESDFAREDYFIEPMPGFEVFTASAAQPAIEYIPTILNQRTDALGTSNALAFSADDRYLYVATRIGTDPNNLVNALVEYDTLLNAATDRGVAIPAPISHIQVLAQSGVVTIDSVGNIIITNATLDVQLQLANADAVQSFGNTNVLSSDGRFIAFLGCRPNSTGEQGACGAFTLNLRSVNTPDLIWSVTLPQGEAFSKVLFSPDDNSILVSGFGASYLFDRAVGTQLSRMSNSNDTFGMLDATFNPRTGEVLTSICKNTTPSTGCTQGEITLWNPLTGQAIGIVLTNPANPLRVLYSPDATLIFIGDADGNILVRYGATGELAQALQVPARADAPRSVAQLVISPDGTKLAAMSDDGVVYFWDITKLYKQ